MRPFVHRPSPLDIHLADELLQPVLRRQYLLATSPRGGDRIVDILEQQAAAFQMAVQHRGERAGGVRDRRPEPHPGGVLGLLLRRDRRSAAHGPRTGEPGHRLFSRELAALQNLPLEGLFARRFRIAVIVHGTMLRLPAGRRNR